MELKEVVGKLKQMQDKITELQIATVDLKKYADDANEEADRLYDDLLDLVREVEVAIEDEAVSK